MSTTTKKQRAIGALSGGLAVLLILVSATAVQPGCATAILPPWRRSASRSASCWCLGSTASRMRRRRHRSSFQDALEQFQAVVAYDGGELESMYKKVLRTYDKSSARAEEVHDRIRKVENVARSLFDEWQDEIGQYSSNALRAESEREWASTKRRYEDLIEVMKEAAEPMDPVLDKLHDQVLFLKHNLNARALGSLQGTVQELELDVASLVEDMQTSIAEADAFIAEMKARNGHVVIPRLQPTNSLSQRIAVFRRKTTKQRKALPISGWGTTL